jgi:hypothetical protein
MAKKKIYDIGIDGKSTPVLGKEKVKYYKSKDGSKQVKKKTFKAKGPKGYAVKKVKEKTKYHKSGLVKSSKKDLSFRESFPLAESPRPHI